MGDSAPFILGSTVRLKGDVTQNKWVGARSAAALESNLGFGRGRLSEGWVVLVLKQVLTHDDFEFSGLTLRSGGRLGLPADSVAADKLRPRVHDEVMRDFGSSGYKALQTKALATITPTGEDRLVKVVPVIRHSATMEPSEQYPMGGGGLQWTLRRPCEFLVALTVDRNFIAIAASVPPMSAFLGESAKYEDRAKLAKFLDSV